MILLKIKRYIQEHKTVTAEHLRNKFDLDQQALEGLLDRLIQQGHIQQTQSAKSYSSGCQSGKCNQNSTKSIPTSYIWSDNALKTLPIRLEIH